MSFVPEAAIALVGVLALRQFYAAFALKWPERYYDGRDGADPLVSRSSGRYFFFRSAPLFLVLVICGTAAERLDQCRPAVAVTLAGVYTLTGPGYAAAQAVMARPFRLGVLIHRLATAGILVVAALAYLFLASRLDPYVPTLREVIYSALIALMIFVFASAGAQLPKVRPNVAALIERGQREIPEHLLTRLNESDPGGVFEAIAIAENINRPAWVRRAERLLVVRNGSYGIMQMRSRRPLSDDESVDLFLTKYARHGKDYWEPTQVKKFVRKHNSTEEFYTLVDIIFYWDRSIH